MSEVQFQGSVPQEVKTVLDPLVTLAQDIKTKANQNQIAADVTPVLAAGLAQWQQLSQDYKSAEAMAYLGYTLGRVAAVFLATAP